MNDYSASPTPPHDPSGQSTSNYTSPDVTLARSARLPAPPTPFVLWPAEPERKNAVEVADIAAIFRRRSRMILLTFLTVVGLSLLYLLLAPRVYEAKATLLAKTSASENDLLTQALGPSEPRSLQTQVAVVRNDLILKRAIHSMPSEQQEGLFRTADVTAEPIPATDLIEVSAHARDKKSAVDLANAVCNQYVQFSQGKNRSSTRSTRQYVQNQLRTVRANLDKAQSDLRRYKERSGVFDLSKEAGGLVDQAQRIEQGWQDARSSKAANLAQLRELQRVVHETPASKVVPVDIRRKPEVESMKLELTRLEGERIRLLQEYTATSDPVLAINGQISALRRKLQTQAQTEVGTWRFEASPVRAAAMQDIARLRGQIWALEAQGTAYKFALGKARSRLAAMPQHEQTLSRLTLDAGALQKSYDLLNERLQALRVNEQARVASAELAFPAELGGVKQIKPNVPRTILLAIMAGLVLALGLAALTDQLDDRMHSEREVRQATQLPMLGSVPFIADNVGHNLYAPSVAPTPLLETFQLLHTNIEFSSADEPIHAIAITSSVPGEGKSVSALNLAIAAALGGERVILVDCDLRRPAQHRLCALSNQIGLSNVLTGAQTLDRALQMTDVPGLRVITSGSIPPNPVKLLKSRAAAALLQQLREQADFIVLDTPPVLALADAQVVTSLADATLLVISSKETGRRDVARTMNLLSQSNTDVIGVLLNKTSGKESGDYYAHRDYSLATIDS